LTGSSQSVAHPPSGTRIIVASAFRSISYIDDRSLIYNLQQKPLRKFSNYVSLAHNQLDHFQKPISTEVVKASVFNLSESPDQSQISFYPQEISCKSFCMTDENPPKSLLQAEKYTGRGGE
jgi:hypothetical protein